MPSHETRAASRGPLTRAVKVRRNSIADKTIRIGKTNSRAGCRLARNGPHEAIEQKIVDLLNLAGKDERTIAVMGVTDEAKGEALVLLTAVDVNLAQLRTRLHPSSPPGNSTSKNAKNS